MGKAGQTWYGARVSEDSEAFVGRLFDLIRIKDGERRPDFISARGRYNPTWSLEVKSTSADKCVVENYQLLYGYTSPREYLRFFRRSLIEDGSFLRKLVVENPELFFGADRVVHYHDVLKRADNTPVGELYAKTSAFQLEYGDHYIMPQDLVFYFFAIGLSMRTGRDLRLCVRELKEFVRLGASSKHPQSFDDIKGDINSMQNLNLGDIRYLMGHTTKLKTRKAEKRIADLKRAWPKVDDLDYSELEGPNKTRIYVLHFQTERNLFRRQLRRTIEETSPKLEELIKERRKLAERMKRENVVLDRAALKRLSEWQI